MTKNCLAPGGLRLQDPIAFGGWGLCPQTPVCDKLELHRLTLHVSHFSHFRHFHFLTIGFFKPSPFSKILWLSAKHRPRLLIFYSMTSLYHKKFLFRKFLMTSLHVFVVRAPPLNQKSWLRLCTEH